MLSASIDGGFASDDEDDEDDWIENPDKLRNYLEIEENFKDNYKKFDMTDAFYEDLSSLVGYKEVNVED
jgi:hypothetical protein